MLFHSRLLARELFGVADSSQELGDWSQSALRLTLFQIRNLMEDAGERENRRMVDDSLN